MAWFCLPSLKLVCIVALWFYFTPKWEGVLARASHPVELNSGSQDCKTSHCEVLLPEISARLQAVPCVILVQWFSPERSPSCFSRVRLRRNGVRFPKRTHDSFRVLCVVRVQRSISGREASHPVFFY